MIRDCLKRAAPDPAPEAETERDRYIRTHPGVKMAMSAQMKEMFDEWATHPEEPNLPPLDEFMKLFQRPELHFHTPTFEPEPGEV